MPKNKEKLQVGCASHFLDSGSFSLWSKAAKYAEENKCGKWDFYDTPEFWDYLDGYAAFVKKYARGIDLYANVDVIPNPELSYRSQKYLERKHGLTPVPVVHYRTDLKWLHKYIKKGYEIIALGGLVGSTSQENCIKWLDGAFEVICGQSNRLPVVKTHGFGITTYSLLLRYPWYSVDSSSWTKVGAFGGIMIPHKRGGKFTFDEQPYVVKVSDDAPDKTLKGKHFNTLTNGEKAIVLDWLNFLKIPLGKFDKDGEVVEHGVITRHTERKAVNLLFFEEMRKTLPEYPWPFRKAVRRGFGFI